MLKKYNKSWDFYKGLSVDQIELSMRKDTVWDRPSWPLTGNPAQIINQIRDLLHSDYSLFEKETDLQKFLKNKIIDENLTPKEQKCIDVLGISMPIKINNIKKAYKKLVKIFHPDVNKNGKKAEKKFREINKANKTHKIGTIRTIFLYFKKIIQKKLKSIKSDNLSKCSVKAFFIF